MKWKEQTNNTNNLFSSSCNGKASSQLWQQQQQQPPREEQSGIVYSIWQYIYKIYNIMQMFTKEYRITQCYLLFSYYMQKRWIRIQTGVQLCETHAGVHQLELQEDNRITRKQEAQRKRTKKILCNYFRTSYSLCLHKRIIYHITETHMLCIRIQFEENVCGGMCFCEMRENMCSVVWGSNNSATCKRSMLVYCLTHRKKHFWCGPL